MNLRDEGVRGPGEAKERMAEAVERGWAKTGAADKPPSRAQSAVLDVERAIKFRASSRASSRVNERLRHEQAALSPPAPAEHAAGAKLTASSRRASGPSSRAPSSRRSDAHSAGSLEDEDGAYSIAVATVSSGTCVGSDVDYARNYLSQHLRPGTSAQEAAFAQRVAHSAKVAVVARKVVLSSIGAAMEGIGIAFRGGRGADTLVGWQNVTGDPSRKPAEKLPAKKLDATGYTQLGYIERGKAESLAQIGDEHMRQQQVLSAPTRCIVAAPTQHAPRSPPGLPRVLHLRFCRGASRS